MASLVARKSSKLSSDSCVGQLLTADFQIGPRRNGGHFMRVCLPSMTSFSGSSPGPISSLQVAESADTCFIVYRTRVGFPPILISFAQVQVLPSTVPREKIFSLLLLVSK